MERHASQRQPALGSAAGDRRQTAPARLLLSNSKQLPRPARCLLRRPGSAKVQLESTPSKRVPAGLRAAVFEPGSDQSFESSFKSGFGPGFEPIFERAFEPYFEPGSSQCARTGPAGPANSTPFSFPA